MDHKYSPLLDEKKEKQTFSKLKRIGKFMFDEKCRDFMLRHWSEHYVYKKYLYVLGKENLENGDAIAVRVRPFQLNEHEGQACVEVHYNKEGGINSVCLCNLVVDKR